MLQLEALVVAVAILAIAAAARVLVLRRGRRRALAASPPPAAEPYILYFTGEHCTVCRTHQEPALSALEGVRIERVDVGAEPDVGRRYGVYTLPTTIVISPSGTPAHVNYGYISADRLRRQLSDQAATQAEQLTNL
jgi:hypothetical protein